MIPKTENAKGTITFRNTSFKGNIGGNNVSYFIGNGNGVVADNTLASYDFILENNVNYGTMKGYTMAGTIWQIYQIKLKCLMKNIQIL